MNKVIIVAGISGFVLFALTLFIVLLPACGARPFFVNLFDHFCPATTQIPQEGRLQAVTDEQRSLEREITDLERELAQLGCESAPMVSPQSEPPGIADSIEQAIQEQDIRSMAGCWDLTSDYKIRNVDTNQIASVKSWQVCFDESGNGRQRLQFSDDVLCQSPVKAYFGDRNTLRIADQGDVNCDNGSFIFERVTICTIANNRAAQCVTTQEGYDARPVIDIERSIQGQ